MNLKLDKGLPSPSNINRPFLLTHIQHPCPSILFYSSPPPPPKSEEPNKKKFLFKPKQTTNTSQFVQIFDPNTLTWTTHQTKGKFPSKRQRSALQNLGHCLLMYGGISAANSKNLNDLYALNLNTWIWKKLFTMEVPPAKSNPVAIVSSDQFVLIQDEVWIFQTKGVNWDAQTTDIPGGVWQKTDIQMPFAAIVACVYEQQILVLGRENGLGACLISIQQSKLTSLEVQGQVKQTFQTLKIIATSQDKGLLIDSNIFISFFIHQNVLYLSQPLTCQQDIQLIAPLYHFNINYAINHRQQVLKIELVAPQPQYQRLDTARQITQQNHHSFIEREHEEMGSLRPPPSPLSTQGMTTPILAKLSPLLARQWLRRRVLEEKGKLLEDTIKKAERMVLALCKYGNQEEKKVHINRVCMLRQTLCKVLQSETFIRREMAERSGQKQLRAKALKEQHGASFFDLNQL